MRIADFDYALPPSSIAQEAIEPRDAARLMRLAREGDPSDHVFRDLPGLLRPGDLLVVNRSRVFPARLLGQREGGGAAEVFLLRDLGDDRWEALVRPGRRLRPGAVVAIDRGLTAVVETAAVGPEGRRVVHLRAKTGSVEAALEQAGHVPLPPYIRRPDRPEDRARYQTVYAREKGSVAAPTAGLHFTADLLDALRAAGIGVAEIVLHVGPGTFRPVTADEIEDHRLEPEPYVVPPETAGAVASARTRGGRVVAVGTTVVRRWKRRPPTREACARGRARPRWWCVRDSRSASWTPWSRTSTFPARRCCSWSRPSRAASGSWAPTRRRYAGVTASTATATRCCSSRTD